jgi:branched-chain amino acid transport system substrate-binding protein
MKACAVAVVLCGSAILATPSMAEKSIKIGLVLAKQGAMAEQSGYLSQGTFLALKQHGNKLLGRPAEVIWVDEPTPQEAQQNMQKLIDGNKVVAVLGGGISANALAMASVAERARIPYIANNAAATDITGKRCNRYTFRIQPPVSVQANALAPYMEKLGKRWYFMIADYAFGQDIENSFGDWLKKADGEMVGRDRVPLNTADYSSFILKIRHARPDVVVGGLAASDLTNFLKQWNELKMKGEVPFSEVAISDTDIWGVGKDAATGIYSTPWYYNNPENSEEDRKFIQAYVNEYGRVPAVKAWMGWYAMRSLLEAIENAKSTEPQRIVQALEEWRDTTSKRPAYYRAWDHQLLHSVLVVGVKPHITDDKDYFDVLATMPAADVDLETIFGSKAGSDCKLGSL